MVKYLRGRTASNDSGIALPLVIAMGTLMGIMVVTAIGYGINGASQSRSTQEWDASLAAAYAGVEEYQSRIAADPEYYKYGNPAAPYTIQMGSVATVSAPPVQNPAFGTGTSGTWASVPGGNGVSRFRYEVDNHEYTTTGVLRIRATGVVGDATRTIVADLKQKGFLDFLYFTDYEIRDPEQSSLECIPAYEWAVASRPSCTEIQFGKFDVLNGPVHSNDSLLVCGARFRGNVTTARPTTPSFDKASGCNDPIWEIGEPTFDAVLGMPSTNSELKKETRSDLTDVPKPGCLYTGPTTIEFLDSGQMKVRSPWTRLTNIAGGDTPTSGTLAAKTNCGVPGSGAGQLGSAGGATIPVPHNNVVFVQNIPLPTPPTMPNGASSDATGSGTSCKDRFTGKAVTGNGLGFPINKEVAPSTSTTSPSYGCRSGDVFVKGKVAGQVTVAAENYVYITDNIVYKNPQADMLGLVGQNSIFVHNPVDKDKKPVHDKADRRIDSALLSMAHTFTVQNYELTGVVGTLTVNGAIAQKFRGPVATQSSSTQQLTSGYAKNYLYDTRFRYTAPPKFLSPVTTSYGVSVWIETERAFDPSGAPR